jgi:solute carrier family 6 amino acid transporter-like protein 5/7/9/14
MIALSFLAVSLITYLTIYRGIDSAKYVVYITVPLPYILMTVLFIKGMTLEGKSIGWIYLFKPDWSKLFTVTIWADAAGQVLFSSSLAQNTVIKFASHRNEKDPLFWSTILLPILNFATSIFASLALFAFIGYASYNTGVDIDDMAIDGMELTFVVYPALINTLPYPQFWSILFFTMLTALGLGSEYILIELVS